MTTILIYLFLWLHFVFFNVLQYVLEELNVRSLVPCNDPLKYASLRAEPDFRYVMRFTFIKRQFPFVVGQYLHLMLLDYFLVVY